MVRPDVRASHHVAEPSRTLASLRSGKGDVMSERLPNSCAHCGAAPAGLFANDGSHVCARCAAAERVAIGELRASQADLGLMVTGDVADVERSTSVAWHREALGSLVAGLAAFALFWFAASDQNALAYVAAAIGTLLSVALGVQAMRVMAFARHDAHRLVESAGAVSGEGRTRASFTGG